MMVVSLLNYVIGLVPNPDIEGKGIIKWSVVIANLSGVSHQYCTVASAKPSNCEEILMPHATKIPR
jgi:hypothetical protein